MPEPKVSKTGNAPIVRQGQTMDGAYGDDPGVQSKYGNKGGGKDTAKDLKPK